MKDEMGAACSTNREEEEHIDYWRGNQRERDC
jgi:hypothetical protein